MHFEKALLKDHLLGHKTISTNSGRLKSYQASFLTIVAWNQKLILRRKLEKHKYVETEQHATKQSMGK